MSGRFCGQTQPHNPHRWAEPFYGGVTAMWEQCSGFMSDDSVLLDAMRRGWRIGYAAHGSHDPEQHMNPFTDDTEDE